MSSLADRNLLFGILALQLDFITREQLISGMQAWVLAKVKPLAELLQHAGSLSAEHRAALEAIVAAHVKQHNNDPQQSLAAISSAAEIHDELSQIADPQLDASLPHIAAAAAKYRSLGDVPTESVGESTSAGTRFRILRPHAQGGLGKVSVARDGELNREVALKEIRPQYADDPGSRSRFMLEAEVTGGLEHPGIVPVYGLGTYPNGRPFYAMRFIRGDSLKEAIARYHDPEHVKTQSAGDRAVELRQLLGRLIDVCQAIQYAHDRGVLHRDLKPGNIMLGKYGETLVVDWGLAKAQGKADAPASLDKEANLAPLSGSSSEATQMGFMIGTLHYMSPEQASGRLDILGPATDIFAIGATLFHLLTGKPPYHGVPQEELAAAVREARFPSPRQVNKLTPKPLSAICMKAMAREPEQRYASCAALVADIEHWLADEPTEAYRETRFERLMRWRRNHPRLVTGLVASLLIGFVSLAATSWILAEKNRLVTEESRRTDDTLNFLLANMTVGARSDTWLDVIRRTARNALNNSGDPKLQLRVLKRLSISLENVHLHQENVAVEEKILELYLTAFPRDYGQIELAYSNVAKAYQQVGRVQDAIKLLEDTGKSADGTNRQGTSIANMGQLSRAYCQAGRFEEGINLYEQMIKFKTQKYGELLCADEFSELGDIYIQAGRAAEGIPPHEKAVRIVGAKSGLNNGNAHEKLSRLAAAYRAAGRYADAIKTYRQIKEFKVAGPVHGGLLETCQELAMTYLANNNFQVAENEFLSLHQKLCDPEMIFMRPTMVPPCMEALISLYEQQQQPADIEKWQSKLAAWKERGELVPVSTIELKK